MLGLPLQGDLAFPGGTMKRFALGQSVLKLVNLDVPPERSASGPRGEATGLRYVSLVVANVREMAERIAAAGHPIVEPLTPFAHGVGFFFTADPDGNPVELAGPI